MNKKFKEFNEQLKKDPKLQRELQTAKNEGQFVVLFCKLANQKGYDISPDEVKEYIKIIKNNSSINHSLNEQDIRKIAAGVEEYCEPVTYM